MGVLKQLKITKISIKTQVTTKLNWYEAIVIRSRLNKLKITFQTVQDNIAILVTEKLALDNDVKQRIEVENTIISIEKA